MYNGNKLSPVLKGVLVAGFLFLYLPIVSLIVYSFNASKLVTVWGGFSTRWYVSLFHNEQILSAVGLSIRIALASATAAVVLGTVAGFVLARFKRFRGSTLFAGMMTAPMVMPEVITGLSMLLLFISMQQLFGQPSERGFFTIWVGHTTLCMAYVAVVVRSRLIEIDKTLEDAAMDLGARPLKIFFVITLPLISQAIASGFLLSITLSLDDLVTTAFLSGPGSTTLPQVIFSKVRLGLNPEINALATITVLIVGIMVVAANYLMLNAQRNREKAIAAAMRENENAQAGPPSSAVSSASA
ncbi:MULTISPECIES: ABC transporter permease subunit [Gulbenkiania]|uniref:ABC-type spermidine/putrescine transport system, permease component II n=2 Tax=Gulbenkiania TaxID=397456 RepID=A0A0K6H5L4_9NEIS|nr:MULTISPECIES: ABC transporter permease subunit [Gulbenkiania]TCW29909.1 putrescine transport system permease protein [Gulbenkiania mobilis]CUA86187.1 ABC-type spermidine/putrescine transport system, permease component II [Gulbenkiania indica]